jgi:hypothetical protein
MSGTFLPLVVDEAVDYDSDLMKQPSSLDRLSAVTEEESAAELEEDECSTTRSHSCTAAPAYEASTYEASALSLPPVADADGAAMAEAETALADMPRAPEEKEDLGDPRLARDCSCCCFGGNSKQGWIESFIAITTLGIVCGW